jgi:hypothetical protein
MEPTKTCTKCGTEHPATPEFFYVNKGKLHSWCKDCTRAYERSRYEKVGDTRREQVRRVRKEQSDRVREQDRVYYTLNRERKQELAREYRQRHREKTRARDRARGRPKREENRRILQEWYSQGCIVCGLVFLPGGMQAHHRNEQEKDIAASQLLSARKGTLATELAKCDPFCATHHFMLTQARREGWDDKPYEELIAMLREQWRETLRASGLLSDAPP